MARKTIDPMTKSNKKPVEVSPLEAGSVVTTSLLSDYIARHGGSMIEAGLRFSDAHMELRITLKADKDRGLGWVTEAEAAQLAAHMEANSGQPAPSPMKWL